MGAAREGWNLLSRHGWAVFWRSTWKQRWWNLGYIRMDTFGRFICAIRNAHGEVFWTDSDYSFEIEQAICKTCCRATGQLRGR